MNFLKFQSPFVPCSLYFTSSDRFRMTFERILFIVLKKKLLFLESLWHSLLLDNKVFSVPLFLISFCTKCLFPSIFLHFPHLLSRDNIEKNEHFFSLESGDDRESNKDYSQE